MKIEHVAFLVGDPLKVANWYCENLGFRVVKTKNDSTQTHFLEGEAGSGIIEIYKQKGLNPPEYSEMNPHQLHLAFVVEDLQFEELRLQKAGARKVLETVTTPKGDKLVMYRDPWGFPIQLCFRV